MKFAFATLLVIFTSTQAFAARSSAASEKDTRKALTLLISESGKLTDQTGASVASILANSIVTTPETSNKISNVCSKNLSDSAFYCELSIKNSDDNSESKEESAFQIRYQLEIGSDGSPSDFFFLTVETSIAG